MGTKNEPGQFNCYAKAEPDEPVFTLRGKDPAAPYLVWLWLHSRLGKWDEMRETIRMMEHDPSVVARLSTDPYEKLDEAKRVAVAMGVWRRAREKGQSSG